MLESEKAIHLYTLESLAWEGWVYCTPTEHSSRRHFAMLTNDPTTFVAPSYWLISGGTRLMSATLRMLRIVWRIQKASKVNYSGPGNFIFIYDLTQYQNAKVATAWSTIIGIGQLNWLEGNNGSKGLIDAFDSHICPSTNCTWRSSLRRDFRFWLLQPSGKQIREWIWSWNSHCTRFRMIHPHQPITCRRRLRLSSHFNTCSSNDHRASHLRVPTMRKNITGNVPFSRSRYLSTSQKL